MGAGGIDGPRIRPGDRVTGWFLRVGPLSLRHERIRTPTERARYSNYEVRWHGVRGESRGWNRWLLIVPMLAAAPVSLWAARTPAPLAARLLVPLPPAVQALPARHKPVTIRQPAKQPNRETSPEPISISADGLDDLPAAGQALRAALRLGEAQDWAAEDGRHGLVVVAPEALSLGGRTCRDTTILIRDGGFEAQTRAGRFCVDAADRVIRVGPVPSSAQE